MEKEKIGKYIRKKRIEKGMTQQQLAEKIQVTEKAVSRWETGRGVPDISLLEPLAEELHVSVTELLNGEERVQEEAVHDTKAHMADIDITNVIEYVQENRKEKYNTGFKIGIGCLVVSLVLFLLYLREAYRFQGNYFGTMIENDCDFGDIFAWRNGVGTLAIWKSWRREESGKRQYWRCSLSIMQLCL